MTMWFWTQFWLLLWLKLKGLNIYSSDKNPKSGTYIWLEFSDSKGFPCGSAGKESACNVEDLDLIPRLWRSLGEGKGYPLQYSGLENSMDCLVHGVAKSWTRLSDFHLTWDRPQTLQLGALGSPLWAAHAKGFAFSFWKALGVQPKILIRGLPSSYIVQKIPSGNSVTVTSLG